MGCHAGLLRMVFEHGGLSAVAELDVDVNIVMGGDVMELLICCLATFFACILGTVCGMGGGIIIKPTLDAAGVMSVPAATFLSGCTVIAMSCWSVGKTAIKKESVLDMGSAPFLAVGAAAGGLAGKALFLMVDSLFADRDTAGGVQAGLLFLATLATLVYTLKKEGIAPKQIRSRAVCVIIGLLLGILGSFLGIGGGPFNVAVLCYFFSMPTKTATQNSLLIVLISQLASTLKTALWDGIPPVDPVMLLLMMILAVTAGETGRRLNRRIDNQQATLCLEGAMVLILCINAYNIYRFLF